MNNRYICKAKRKDNGEWIEGYLYITHNGEYEISRYDDELDTERITYIVIPETVVRCTEGSKSTCLNGWISVKDRLPEDYKDVLAYDSGHKEIVIAFYDSESEEWTYGNWYDGEITYWQPLPELLEVER